ncbi:hypothetical protein BDV96DRAFT_642074 [Lophiotrema nucula]|uniref:Uncharacterized protein n=1 Tax=Lophiotrema nucula TaxID=690887 RepID=A0A6A5ZPS5_9PLEO|nr:hypothetical protein BDV96DRAFT_642074 [Lophiotrema nucula]
MLHPADLAVGLAVVGYGVWKRYRPQRPKTIDIDEPYLLNIPAEIRLIIYDFVFGDDSDERPARERLEPLLICRQIHDEAFPTAFARTKFVLTEEERLALPFWSPRILRLPAPKLNRLRNLELAVARPPASLKVFAQLFHELEHGPLCLSALTLRFLATDASMFHHRLAPVLPETAGLCRYILEELPLLDNVKKIVIPNPGVKIKRSFQLLFAPNKPRLQLGNDRTVRTVAKKLGRWEYNIIMEDKDVKTWRLELVHPTIKKEAT